MINYFRENIELKDRDAVIKLHMIVKIYQGGYKLSAAELDTLFELYKTGYNPTFFKNCISKKYFKTPQVVRNAVIRMTKMGLVTYKKRGVRHINENLVPKITESKVIFQYMVGNPRGNKD